MEALGEAIERALLILVFSTCAGAGAWCLAAFGLAFAAWRKPRRALRVAVGVHGAAMLLASTLPAVAVAVLASPDQSIEVWAVVALVSAPMALGGVVDLVAAVVAGRRADVAPAGPGDATDPAGA